MDHVIECREVTFSFRRRRVLTGASWNVGPGVTALLGPNGAGKTTLLRCIVGLISPSSGTIRLAGRSVTDAPDRSAAQRLVGFLPQQASMPSFARVGDMVAYAAWLSAVPSASIPERVRDTLTQMRVEDLSSRRIGTLSGGQRQRVALATSLVHDPQIVVLDEPTVGLDPAARLAVRETIARIGRDRTVLLSTHLTEDVERLADNVGVLVDGQFRFDGPRAGLLAASRETTAGSSSEYGSDFEHAYSALVSQREETG